LNSGYELVYTPHIAKLDLWNTSGHTEFYRDNMYPPMELEDASYQLKPMNCPFHILIYKNQIRSYRDLPIRLAEFGTVYRSEKSGVLHGMTRVRGMLDLTKLIFNTFGFKEFEVCLSTIPEKFVGEPKDWEHAEGVLKRVLETYGWKYSVAAGEAAFYGPKIDIFIKDAIGRSWQCTTIQFDFNLPQRFDLHYTASDGKFYRPIMVHRAIFGSMERFFGILVEHYAGSFPLWLAPVQVALLPITDGQVGYCEKLKSILERDGVRVQIDGRNQKINYKIREAENQKVPYMLIVGKREEEANKVSVRRHHQGDVGQLEIKEFASQIRKEVENLKQEELD
jgi:threonyl-tRNA synthetase